ncbi:MAG: S46 family peptidase [bacterium]
MEFAKSLFGKTPEELADMHDPFIDMISAVYPLIEENNESYESFAANVTELRKQYIDALYAWKGENMYPDANSTLRFTSGPVKGYEPADAVWYKPFTTLTGVVKKDRDKEPFDAPDKLVQLQKENDLGIYVDPDLKDVPVAFLHQCDITGGNSGSPVMNARGELIGVAFDGNYEAMISDWQYDYDLQRTISVDIRYVMFITDKFADADYILEEMGVSTAGFSMK